MRASATTLTKTGHHNNVRSTTALYCGHRMSHCATLRLHVYVHVTSIYVILRHFTSFYVTHYVTLPLCTSLYVTLRHATSFCVTPRAFTSREVTLRYFTSLYVPVRHLASLYVKPRAENTRGGVISAVSLHAGSTAGFTSVTL